MGRRRFKLLADVNVGSYMMTQAWNRCEQRQRGTCGSCRIPYDDDNDYGLNRHSSMITRTNVPSQTVGIRNVFPVTR